MGVLPYFYKAIKPLRIFLVCCFELQISTKLLFVTSLLLFCIIKPKKVLCLIPSGNITLPVKAWSNTAALYALSLLIGTVIYPAFLNINSVPMNRLKLGYLKWNAVRHKVLHPLSPSLASITWSMNNSLFPGVSGFFFSFSKAILYVFWSAFCNHYIHSSSWRTDHLFNPALLEIKASFVVSCFI